LQREGPCARPESRDGQSLIGTHKRSFILLLDGFPHLINAPFGHGWDEFWQRLAHFFELTRVELHSVVQLLLHFG
jgi:hypothetical protein